MNLLDSLIEGKIDDFKKQIFERLNKITASRLEEAKRYVAEDMFESVEVLDEAGPKRNNNIIKMGRVQKIRRRIRRNAKGKIIVQKNVKRSGIKGYRISGKGNVVKRISSVERLRKARLLKRSWKTTRRAKLRRTLLKRKMSMRRRSSMGLR
jgi:hypothetical protein